MLDLIRTRGPNARIIVLNVPDLAALPFAATFSTDAKAALHNISVLLDENVINPLALRSITVIDTLRDARSYDPANYSSDGYHPNDQGYAILAGLIVSAVQGASPSPTSCPPHSQLASSQPRAPLSSFTVPRP